MLLKNNQDDCEAQDRDGAEKEEVGCSRKWIPQGGAMAQNIEKEPLPPLFQAIASFLFPADPPETVSLVTSPKEKKERHSP